MEVMLKNYSHMIGEYAHKRYHVIGIGRSGVGIANLLAGLGAHVRLSDTKDREELDTYLDKIGEGIHVITGRQDNAMLSDIDCLVLSPGVPQDSEVVSGAVSRGIEVVGEIELSYRVTMSLAENTGHKVRWFGITGTNGKSTTATLLYEMLRRGERNCVLSGNIGYPLSAEVEKLLKKPGLPDNDELDIVLELSSFQLEIIRDFKLDISALLNITADHLDRYEDIGHYADAKAGIFNNQDKNDYAVINADDPLSVKISRNCSARKYFMSASKEVEGAYAKDGYVYIQYDGKAVKLMAISDIRIAGLHNLYNSLTAVLMASVAGLSDEDIVDALKEFSGLEHRLEFAGETGGIKFYNDSKGTNVGAVVKSLESFDSNVILIAGGRDKNGDFASLIPYVKNRVKKVVVIGEASEKIKSILEKTVPVEMAVTLKDAVSEALAAAENGDIVLFSPACASFDMFRDFEDRGRQFKQITRELLRGN